MKYLDGQEVLKGDAVIAPTDEIVVVGQVHQFLERSGHIRISGYALPVKADTAVLASRAYAEYATPFIAKAKAAAEEAAKAKAEAAQT